MFYSKCDKRLTAEITKQDKHIKTDAYLSKGKKVIVLGEENGRTLVCPLGNDVIYKNSIPIDVVSLGKSNIYFQI